MNAIATAASEPAPGTPAAGGPATGDAGRPFWQRHGLQPVAAVPAGGPRPLLTVAIPLYIKTGQDFSLAERCLRSVLAEAAGHDDLELLAVDDASPTPGVDAFVADVGRGRVRYARNERNLLITGNWRRCVDLGRGEWVHLLHDDDFVFRGFYQRIRQAIASHPQVGQIATQVLTCSDPLDLKTGLTMRFTAPGPTVFPDWLAQVSEFSKLWHTGVVTRRSVYEAIGNWGFDSEFPPYQLALDWEFFVRTACAGVKTLFIPEVLAFYSQNSTSTSIEHDQRFENLTALTLIRRLQRYLGPEAARPLVRTCADWYLGSTWRHLVAMAQQFAYEAVRRELAEPGLAELLTHCPERRDGFAQFATLVADQGRAWEQAPEFFSLSHD